MPGCPRGRFPQQSQPTRQPTSYVASQHPASSHPGTTDGSLVSNSYPKSEPRYQRHQSSLMPAASVGHDLLAGKKKKKMKRRQGTTPVYPRLYSANCVCSRAIHASQACSGIGDSVGAISNPALHRLPIGPCCSLGLVKCAGEANISLLEP
ncbi:hypothetical protein LY76DRAFT_154915 [Colletotrichum caudatum]|nr:hypothetical protein LY76DRAFT_154915 [Colletotrichum caudatum]